MSKPFRAQVSDPKGAFAYNTAGDVIFCNGSGAPTASLTGFAIGCIYQRTDGTASTAFYINTGTATSTTWAPVVGAGGTLATLTVTDLTATNAAISNASFSTGITTAGATIQGNSSFTGAFLTMGNGSSIITNTTTGMQIATNNTQKVGMFGATAIVQPATTGVTAGSASLIANNNSSSVYVTNVSTFNGNTGSKAYTLNDIVAALKTLGALATS